MFKTTLPNVTKQWKGWLLSLQKQFLRKAPVVSELSRRYKAALFVQPFSRTDTMQLLLGLEWVA
jgi:hypothetical protein